MSGTGQPVAESAGRDGDERVEEAGSLTDRAYRRLEELIVTLQLKPGAVLSEVALCERLGIGRTPVREALQRLGREGLITILPRRGILVSEINVESQLRLLEVRRVLERLLGSRAARLASPQERAQFRQIADGMTAAAESSDDIAFMRLDRELNVLLCEAGRNEFATRAMSLNHGLSRRFWYHHYKAVADLPLCARLHADLALAIAEGEVGRAADASDDLLDYIESFTRAALSV